MQLPVLVVNASLHAALFAALFFAIAAFAVRLSQRNGRVRLSHHLPGHLAQLRLQGQRSRVLLLLATALVAVLTFAVALFIDPPFWMQQASALQRLALQGLVSVVLIFFVVRLIGASLSSRLLRQRCESRVAVGVALASIFHDRSQVFHDVPLPASGATIDDVLVGPSGVFVVQTCFANTGSSDIKLVADSLLDASDNLIQDVSAGRYLVRQLQQLLNLKCTPAIKVRRVLVVPGAEICEQANPDCLVVNETRLSIIRGWTDPSGYLLDEQIAAVAEALAVRPKTAVI
ncbi:MAG: nuclease-related domain-containing protein [Pseudomonadota bacterium]